MDGQTPERALPMLDGARALTPASGWGRERAVVDGARAGTGAEVP